MSIDQLLRQRFPYELLLNPQTVRLEMEVHSSDFTLSDSKACDECQALPERINRQNCNRETLKIKVENDWVTVVNLECYLEQFHGFREKCDYLLLDDTDNHRKICFCDLTCSAEKWVAPNEGKYSIGKRAKAKNQMLHSLEYLLQEYLLAHFILTFATKECVFGWRDYEVPAVPPRPSRNDVLGNMQSFSRTPSSMASQIRTHEHLMEHEFTFVQIKYPNEYKW